MAPAQLQTPRVWRVIPALCLVAVGALVAEAGAALEAPPIAPVQPTTVPAQSQELPKDVGSGSRPAPSPGVMSYLCEEEASLADPVRSPVGLYLQMVRKKPREELQMW